MVVFHAASFLLISDVPVKTDAVVLFLGGEKDTREKEAIYLISKGFATYLIIPANRQVKRLNPDGKTERFVPTTSPNTSHLELKTAAWREDTHKEAILAKAMIENMGLKSVIVVSSPYHMRRIKVIIGNVFNGNVEVRYVPTRYEALDKRFWLYQKKSRNFVLTEYAKIVWFLLYRPFV